MKALKMISGNLLIEKARVFATAAHGAVGQKRKYTGQPYIVHPLAVSRIVASVVADPEIIAAALLHDVVEDTSVTLEDISSEFGSRVASLVESLTDISRPEDGNRETRKSIDRNHIVNASPEAKTVKLADLIDNTRTIVQYDLEFAKIYLKEKKLLLEVLLEGNPLLLDRARYLLKDCFDRI